MHSSPEAEEKQHAKGKYTARERIEKLLDPGSFQELDTFVRHRTTDFDMQKNRPWGDAVVTGHGTIDGRRVCVFSQDFTVFGGSLGEVMAEKMCKIMDLAAKIGCPVIGINDSGGARIQEGVVSLGAYGDVFVRNVKCSGVIPQISLIMGPCAGGAVYSPAITDFIFMVKETSHMFITGPDVIKTVTGEEVELRGARRRDDPQHQVGRRALRRRRRGRSASRTRATCCRFLPQNNLETPPRVAPTDDPDRMDPELDTIVPDNPNKPYDMRDVVRAGRRRRRVLRGPRALRPEHHRAASRASNGHAVGVVGNQPAHMAGVLDIDASRQGARASCAPATPSTSRSSPSATSPASCPAPSQEWGGIIRHGAKLLYAYHRGDRPEDHRHHAQGLRRRLRRHGLQAPAAPTSTSPGRPAEVAVMGPEGAVNIIYRRDIASSPTPDERRDEADRRLQGALRQPVQRGRARLHRRRASSRTRRGRS